MFRTIDGPSTMLHASSNNAALDSVAFACDAFGGFGQTHGLASPAADGLRLQYQTRDAMIGLLRSTTRHALVPLEAIVDLRFRYGFLWFSPRIELRVAELAVLTDIPGAEGSRLVLKVRRADREHARKLVHLIGSLLAERRLDHLQGELERMSRAGTAVASEGAHRSAGPAVHPPPQPPAQRQ